MEYTMKAKQELYFQRAHLKEILSKNLKMLSLHFVTRQEINGH